MFNSIRSRIAIGYVLVWVFILTICAGGFYLFRQHTLNQQLDNSLSSTVEVIYQSLKYEIEEEDSPIEGDPLLREVILLEHQRDFPGQAVSVFEGDRLIVQKPGEGDLAIAATTGLGDGSVPFLTFLWKGESIRVVQRFVNLPKRPGRYRLVVAESRKGVETLLGRARIWLTALVLVTVVIASTFGYFLARACLRPVVQMAKAAERLEAEMDMDRQKRPDAELFGFGAGRPREDLDPSFLEEGLPLLKSQDELGFLANTFRRLLEHQYRVCQQQRQFMADASHELKTPISISLITTQVTLERERTARA